MSIIQDKYNIRFDFETQNLNIPIDNHIFSRFTLNHKAFVANYISVAGGQLFDANKTIYKYNEDGFYLTVYFEQAKIGLLFVFNKDDFSDEYIEKLRVYCDFMKIKLGIIHLFSNSNSEIPSVKDNIISLNVSGNDKLDVLDEKIKNLMNAIVENYASKYITNNKVKIYQELDKELCYRLGILLSISPKTEPKKPVIKNGRIV